MGESGTRAALSIVIPFHNVEPYFQTCLESLRTQTFADFEVVMVDDASSDGSAEIADRFASTDPRFRVVRSAKVGVGVARNIGIENSRGDLLAFVDADDYVPEYAYELMTDTLARTGSDFVAGNARRFDSVSVWQSWSHRRPFVTTRMSTHCRRTHILGIDRYIWNKVYRRDFWDSAGLTFPDMLYEDYPVALAAHIRARQVDVLADPIYYWRHRDGGEASITQSHWNLDNLSDRVRSAEMLFDMVDEHAPYLSDLVKSHLTATDVQVLARSIEDHPAEEAGRIFDLAARYLARVDDAILDRQGPFERLVFDLLRRRRRDALTALTRYRAEHGTQAPLARRRDGWYAKLPSFEDRAVGVPDSVFRLSPAYMKAKAVATEAWWSGSQIAVRVNIGINTLPLRPRTRFKVWLESPTGGKVPVEHVTRPRAIAFGQVDRSTLELSIDPARLAGDRQWRIMIGLRNRDVRDVIQVTTSGDGRERWQGWRRIGNRWCRPGRLPGGFGVTVRDLPDAWVDHTTDLGDEFEIRGAFRGSPPEEAELTLTDRGGSVVTHPLTIGERGDRGVTPWRVTVPVDAVLEKSGLDVPMEEIVPTRVKLVRNGRTSPLPVHPDFLGSRSLMKGRAVNATRDPNGCFVITATPDRPVVHDAWWRSGDLVLRGPDGPRLASTGAVLRTWPTPEKPLDVALDVADRDGVFEVTVPVRTLRSTATEHGACETTRWSLLDGRDHKPVVVARELCERVPQPAATEAAKLEFGWSDEIHLRLAPATPVGA
ncbi:glycosyltransferase family 2 protein [Nocardioides sp. CCNWLW239]|uniref:glycosyltransferase family 2 protein n=1 Tax=Nocardioides sp. CCNWLW239 TaxID=3128902 RepID=UPI0030185F99